MHIWFSPTIVELAKQTKTTQNSEHKYDLIVSGIDESPKGSPYHKCIINKTQSVATILHLLNPEINVQNYHQNQEIST